MYITLLRRRPVDMMASIQAGRTVYVELKGAAPGKAMKGGNTGKWYARLGTLGSI
jgi:hypothetical protein